ncbi:MAG: sulfatase-like hydrolase/transferase, partial [Armatimonadetes bacterium]|nr:sulfatase-like hydrolase/transferase [Armatimonadota bacterium]
MSWDSFLKKALSRRVMAAFSLAGALALMLAWQRPWADSVMTATVTLSTDGAGVVAEREVRALFSEGRGRRPVCEVELDLGRWEGQLVRVDVGGKVSRRELPEGETGCVACAAELLDGEGGRPLEFAGWQQGPETGLHIGPVGPQSFEVEGASGFVFAMKGALWIVVRAREDQRVRLRLRAVLTADLAARPKPFVPAGGGDEDPGMRWPVRKPDRPPDVFIYLIDALRADHLGCYGYERGTSPTMDAFAREATMYEHALTPSTWTRPSVATMLTGLHASVHRAMHESDVLDEWPVLLPEMLHEAGYGTICVTTNDQVGKQAGFEQGYDRFLMTEPPMASWVNKVARSLLETWDPEQPVFMYLHTMEPHEPYDPRPESFRLFDRGFKGRFDGSLAHMKDVLPVRPGLTEEDYGRLVDLYDGEIFDADRGFALFLDTLQRVGRFENS